MKRVDNILGIIVNNGLYMKIRINYNFEKVDREKIIILV